MLNRYKEALPWAGHRAVRYDRLVVGSYADGPAAGDSHSYAWQITDRAVPLAPPASV